MADQTPALPPFPVAKGVVVAVLVGAAAAANWLGWLHPKAPAPAVSAPAK